MNRKIRPLTSGEIDRVAAGMVIQGATALVLEQTHIYGTLLTGKIDAGGYIGVAISQPNLGPTPIVFGVPWGSAV